MGVMLAKEQTKKDAAGTAEFLIESLAVSMATVPIGVVIAGQDSAKMPQGRRKATRSDVSIGPSLVVSDETRELVRSAIERTEKTHPGMRVVMLDEETLVLAKQIREHLPDIRDARSDQRIIKLIEALVEFNDPLGEPRQKIDIANAELRVRFMANVTTVSSTEIAELAHRKETSNPHNLASRWKSAKKIFAVDWQGQQRFPAFQFEHGQPRKVIRDVLQIFDEALGPWETAFWFVSSNKWLDGKAPVRLLDDREAIIRAAYSTVGERYG
jgi:hypothetical protein